MQVKTKTISKDAETPSEKVVREARPIRTVVDSRGRSIMYRRLGVLDEAKLARQLGSELASNSEYMRYVRIAAAVQTIDGDYGTAATKQAFIEARIEWIGDEGYIAVWDDMIAQMQKDIPKEDDDDESVQAPGADLKN